MKYYLLLYYYLAVLRACRTKVAKNNRHCWARPFNDRVPTRYIIIYCNNIIVHITLECDD